MTDPTALPPEAAEPLASVHTHTFPPLLHQLGASLLVSTYQAGKLIMVRADGEHINTHFRSLTKPMGIAYHNSQVAIGCAAEVWTYRNIPAVAGRLDPPQRNDAVYVPRQQVVTGDIDIHEMNWVGSQLWFINTRFSTLCTLDPEYSFVPQWRPPFVSALTPEDRCHLNGLGLRDGQPRYITALGESDSAGGWRERKADGGILMDLQGNRLLLRGLSMPHSPRWHNGRLWFLESGRGALCYLEESGAVQRVATLPGFTRGLHMVGNVAFIGLSFVRETAIFSGIPITEQQGEQVCGVWAVNIDNGQTIAFLQFKSGVREIFAVELVPHRFPELLPFGDKLIGTSYTVPDAALREVPTELRGAGPL